MPVPATPPAATFDGGCVFIDGAYAPLAEAKISMFDWGFTLSDVTYDKQLAGIDLHISARQRIAPQSVDPTVKN